MGFSNSILSKCFLHGRSNLVCLLSFKIKSLFILFLLSSSLGVTAQKIYWVDRSTDQIQRANLDGSNAGLFFDVAGVGSNDPYGIALDKINNYIYWTDFISGKVYKGRFFCEWNKIYKLCYTIGTVKMSL